jgi:glycosyltransferase involved in cell wall biosynthesis
MNVSVIIPVYNAAKFVGDAVASIVHQEHVAEVILAEDGSRDESLSVCRELADANPKVALFTHPNGENLGAGATRNLGVSRSQSELIAFLDADDIALPNRFEFPVKMLAETPTIDGVYEAIGTMFEDSSDKERWEALGFKEHLTTVTKVLRPDELFYHLVLWKAGHFHLDGLVVRKKLFYKVGGFNNSLRLHQDSDLHMKLAATGTLVPGRLSDPVAVRRVHSANRYMQPRERALQSRLLQWTALYDWAKETKQSRSRRLIAQYRLVMCLKQSRFGKKKRHPLAIFYAAMIRLMRLEIFARRKMFGAASF